MDKNGDRGVGAPLRHTFCQNRCPALGSEPKQQTMQGVRGVLCPALCLCV